MRATRTLQALALLLLVLFAGCAARTSQNVVAPSGPSGVLGKASSDHVVSVWQSQLCRYIADQGSGDDAVLAGLRRLRASGVLRPARIRFGVLEVEDGAGRFDVQGVLVGRHRNGVFVRYVFVVGVVGHREYLSSEVSDLRVVVLSPVAGTLVWEAAAQDRDALNRYRAVFALAAASTFPADDDDFTMAPSYDRISVREMRSGAEWALVLRPDLRDTRGMLVSFVAPAPREGTIDGCVPRVNGSGSAG